MRPGGLMAGGLMAGGTEGATETFGSSSISFKNSSTSFEGWASNRTLFASSSSSKSLRSGGGPGGGPGGSLLTLE